MCNLQSAIRLIFNFKATKLSRWPSWSTALVSGTNGVYRLSWCNSITGLDSKLYRAIIELEYLLTNFVLYCNAEEIITRAWFLNLLCIISQVSWSILCFDGPVDVATILLGCCVVGVSSNTHIANNISCWQRHLFLKV